MIFGPFKSNIGLLAASLINAPFAGEPPCLGRLCYTQNMLYKLSTEVSFVLNFSVLPCGRLLTGLRLPNDCCRQSPPATP